MSSRTPVAFVRCRDYGASLQGAVTALIGHLGGPAAFWKPGQKVLIKPNLLSDRLPEQGATTHPEVIRALIRLVKTSGALPLVGDSPASSTKLQQVLEKTGMKKVVDEEGAELVNMEEASSVRFETDGCVFTIARPFLEADAVINVPKFKAHTLTILTAGVKNLYGVVPGFQKTHLHRTYPDIRSFSRLLNAIASKTPVTLNVVDAVVGMEGNGPTAGTLKSFEFLAASRNVYELDYFLCLLTGIPSRSVPYLFPPPNGVSRPESIEEMDVKGEVDAMPSVPRCRTPSTLPGRLIPGWLVRLIGPLIWIRPRIDPGLCSRCGRCVKSCPMSALRQDDRKEPPVLSPTVCIGCCCCHEVCPSAAIDMRQSPLLKAARRGRMP